MKTKTVIYDAGIYCPGYSCCKKAGDTLIWCSTKQGYVGNKSLACDDHAVSWARLAKERTDNKKKVDQ